MVMLAAALKATVELDLSKADAGLAQFDARMTRSAQSAQRAATAMDRAFAGAKVTPNITGIASMGSALDSLGTKLTTLASKPHNIQVTARIQAAQAEVQRLNAELTRLKGQPATVQVKADTRAAREQLAELRREVQQVQQAAGPGGKGGGLSGMFSGVAGGMAQFAVARNLLGGLTDAIGGTIAVAGTFEQKLSAIQATTAATGPELASLKQLALDLGQAMDVGSVSASDAADAIFELSKAGLSTSAILDGAAKAVLQMSAAAGPDFGVGNAAALAASAMNTFSRENLNAVTVANTFVGAANASNASLGSLQLGFAAVGSVAATVGLSFHDTAEALALFANKGLQGSDAGTSLKTMLLNLQPHTKEQVALFDDLGITVGGLSNKFFDAQGHIQGLAGIADVLRTALAGMTDQQRLATLQTMFGTDAVRAAAIIYGEGATGVDKLSAAMEKQGDAAAAAATMSDNAKGKFEALTGTLETLQITAGTQVTPQLGHLAEALNRLAASPGMNTIATNIGIGMAAAVNNITNGINQITGQMTREDQVMAETAQRLHDRLAAQGIDVSTQLVSMWINAGNQQNAVVQQVMAEITAEHTTSYSQIEGNALVHMHQMRDIYGRGGQEASDITAAWGSDMVLQGNITGAAMLQVGQATGSSYANALANALAAGAPALNKYWDDLESLFDQQYFFEQIGVNNAKAYTAGLARELHMELGDKTGIFRDPALDKWINQNMDQLVREDIRAKRMSAGPGNAAIQAAQTWASVGRTPGGAANLPGWSGGEKIPKGKKAGGSKAPEAISAIKAATDQTQAISKAITDGIAALNQLSQFTQPAGLQAGLDAFAADTNLVMMRLQQIALNFTTKGLTATSQLADSAGKVYGMLSAGLDYYSKLTEATQKGVTFSGANLAATQALVTSTVSTVTAFGRLVPPWKDTQTAQVMGFADASGKVFGALSAGVDLGSKIAEATGKGVDFGSRMQASTEQLARTTIATVSLFGGLVPPWKTEQVTHVGEYADASGKVLSGLSSGVDLASKIADATKAGVGFSASLVTQAGQLAISSSAIVQQFGAVVPAWDDLANSKVSAYADTSAKVLGTVGAATDTLSKLRDSKLGLEQIQSLVPVAAGVAEATNLIALSFRAGMPAWDEVASTGVGTYADATGKIAAAVSGTTDTLAKLRDSELGLPAIQALVPTAAAVGEAANLIAQSFKAHMPAWDEFATKTVGDFADGAAKAVAAVGGTVDTFQKLQSLDSLVVPWAAMDASMQLLIDTTEHFGNQTRTWDSKAVAASATLADSSSKIVAGVSGAFDLLGKLQGLENLTVPDAALNSVITLLTQATDRFQAASARWESKGLAAAAANAESVGKVASALGAGVDVLTKLSTYQAPSTAQIDSYFTGLTLFITAWQSKSKAWEAKGLAAAAETADSAGKIATGIGAAIDPLVKLGDFHAPSQEGIDQFFAAMGALILGFQSREAAWAAQMTPATVQLASDVGTVTGAISSAIEPLSKMSSLAEHPLDPAQIDQTFALIGLTLQTFQGLITAIPPDQLAAAVAFGGQLAGALGSVQSAVDLVSRLAQSQADPNAVSALLAGIATALAQVPANLAQGVTDNLAPAVAELHTAGDQLMQGLAGGINDGQHWVTDAATAAVNAAIAAAKSAAGIASPSKRAYAELGLPIPQGQARGILAGIPLLKDAMHQAMGATFTAGTLPLPPALPGSSGYSGHGPGTGGGGATIIKDSVVINGALTAQTPTATHDLLVATARREAIKNPGKVG